MGTKRQEQCICSLCCYGFPCTEYTWESACVEAFKLEAIRDALEHEGVTIADVIVISI